MFKNSISIIVIILILTGCTAVLPNETETTKTEPEVIEQSAVISDPLAAINENYKFSFSDARPTQITITPEKLDPLRLKVIIFEDMLKDDSVKSMEHTMIVEQQDDESWSATESELTDFDCWRGRTEEGCM